MGIILKVSEVSNQTKLIALICGSNPCLAENPCAINSAQLLNNNFAIETMTNEQEALTDSTDKPKKPSINQISTYDKVRVACEYILSNEDRIDSNNAIPGSELLTKAKAEFPDQFDSFSKNTFIQYLSRTVKDTESSINCLGKKQGYYISYVMREVIETSPDSDISLPIVEETPIIRRQKEALLYSVLESWLIAQGYQSANVSSSRSLGKWGNPDLAGINALDNFSGVSLEVVTIEAKTSLENWEQWIFEAISHRRFANRSYFAFAHPEETISKIPQDIRYYAELYNIGVLVLSLDNKKFQKLIGGELEDPLDSEDVDILEIYSAPYNFVQPKYQIKFCNALGINCAKKLYQWGKRPAEV